MGTPDNRLIFPGVSFGSDRVGPPSSLYVTPDTFLYTRVLCGTAAQGISVHFRVMLPNGKVSSGRQDFATGAARTVVTQGFPLPEGYLLSVAVHPVSGTLQRGQCFVQAGLERGGAPDFEPMQILVSEYLTTSAVLGWPGGKLRSSLEGPGWLRSITGTDPAAGAEIVETVPAGVRWRPLLLTHAFTTSAAVANREPQLALDDGANLLALIPSGSSQPASLTLQYSWSRGAAVQFAAVGVSAAGVMPDIVLPAGARIRTQTVNLQAADNYSAPQYLVEEWQDL